MLYVRDLTDKQMLEFMGRENLEDYNADFLCMLETWEAGSVFLAASAAKPTQPLDIARLLGWTRLGEPPVMMSLPPAPGAWGKVISRLLPP